MVFSIGDEDEYGLCKKEHMQVQTEKLQSYVIREIIKIFLKVLWEEQMKERNLC